MSGREPPVDAERLLDEAGPAAPPRENGELVFAAPWESRVFGLAVTLHERGLFAWEAFRERLIAEIGAFDASGRPASEWSYYACWQRALEGVLAERGVVGTGELERRATEFAARPPGHDHGHEH